GPAEATRCDEVVYTYEVSNAGTGTINNVKISDPLESGLTTVDGKKTADFNIGNLEAGQKRTVTARLHADKGGEFESKATASADSGMVAESSIVNTILRDPKLTVTAKCPERQFIGRNIEYEYTVTNDGDGVSRDTVLETNMPANTQFVNASE